MNEEEYMECPDCGLQGTVAGHTDFKVADADATETLVWQCLNKHRWETYNTLHVPDSFETDAPVETETDDEKAPEEVPAYEDTTFNEDASPYSTYSTEETTPSDTEATTKKSRKTKFDTSE